MGHVDFSKQCHSLVQVNPSSGHSLPSAKHTNLIKRMRLAKPVLAQHYQLLRQPSRTLAHYCSLPRQDWSSVHWLPLYLACLSFPCLSLFLCPLPVLPSAPGSLSNLPWGWEASHRVCKSSDSCFRDWRFWFLPGLQAPPPSSGMTSSFWEVLQSNDVRQILHVGGLPQISLLYFPLQNLQLLSSRDTPTRIKHA